MDSVNAPPAPIKSGSKSFALFCGSPFAEDGLKNPAGAPPCNPILVSSVLLSPKSCMATTFLILVVIWFLLVIHTSKRVI